MIDAFIIQNEKITKTDFFEKNTSYFWIDLTGPTSDEIKTIENLYGLILPLENTNDGSIANRFYQDNQTYFLTLLMSEEKNVLIIIKNKTFITVHSGEYLLQVPQNPITNITDLLSSFVSRSVQEIAQNLEIQESLVLQLSQTVNNCVKEEVRNRTCETLTKKTISIRINSILTTVINHRRRLVNLKLITDFAAKHDFNISESTSERINVLIEHTDFMNNQVSFLQSTLLSYVNISQYNIQSKLTSFAAMFVLPTMIMSFFSLNFTNYSSLRPFLLMNYGLFFVLGVMFLGSYIIYRYTTNTQKA